MAYENIDADYIASTTASQPASSVVQIDLNNAGLWKANYCAARNANIPLWLGWKCNYEGPSFNSIGSSITVSLNGGSYNSVSLSSSLELDWFQYMTTRYGASVLLPGSLASGYKYRNVIILPASVLGTEHLTSMSIRYTEADGSYYTNNNSNTLSAVVFSVASYTDDMFGNMDLWAAMDFAGTYNGDVPSEGSSISGQIMMISG